MASLQCSCFLTEILVGTPANSAFPDMPGRTFLQSGKTRYFCSGPIGVDPICPRPTLLGDRATGTGGGLEVAAGRPISLLRFWISEGFTQA